MKILSGEKNPESSGVVALSKRKKDTENPPYLQKEIISDILHWLPADFLYDSARYVCKTWNELLHSPTFIKSQLLHSDSGFILDDHLTVDDPSHHPRYITLKDWKLHETNVFPESIGFSGRIIGSSDGVLLISTENFEELFVANPIIRQVLKLPSFPTLVCHCGIASIPPTGVLKVVGLGIDVDSSVCLYDLILGREMAWRKITVAAPGYRLDSFDKRNLVSVNGVIYKEPRVDCEPRIDCSSILAIDLRDECTHHLKVPLECHGLFFR